MKVLFIHHGSHAGGAPLSMLYTMQGLQKKGYRPIAALIKPSDELHKLYNDNGFETIETPWIPIFITWIGSEGKRYNPIVWRNIARIIWKWRKSKRKLLETLKLHQIDIVHLNSVCLSNCASVLMEDNFPFVWHVREHGPFHQGFRYRFIKSKVLQAREVIFLSKAEQKSWTNGNSHGSIVNNFVSFDQFDSSIKEKESRTFYDVQNDKNVILYVGGVKAHKGIVVLLSALGRLKNEKCDFVCLMPDTMFDIDKPKSRLERKCARIIKKFKLSGNCKMMPFDPNIVKLFSACDVLVFPATKPHFARPIVEASAMGKPVVAPNIAVMDELVVNEKTGVLFKNSDPIDLSGKIASILHNKEKSQLMGRRGYIFAREKFGSQSQMEKILRIYNRL